MENLNEESIYNLVPMLESPKQKKPLYKSKFNPALPPSASTLINPAQSIILDPVISGNKSISLISKKINPSFGYPAKSKSISPNEFLKKHDGEKIVQDVSKIALASLVRQNMKAYSPEKKPRVPSHFEADNIFGLQSKKDFIALNKSLPDFIAKSQATITPETKKSQKILEDASRIKGKVPMYLIHRQLEMEKSIEVERIKQENEQKNQNKLFHRLPTPEIEELRKNLKEKWDELTHNYQMLTHKRYFASQWSELRKIKLEKEIEYIEKCIARIDKSSIYIDECNKFPALVQSTI